jgi:hypothetical protein
VFKLKIFATFLIEGIASKLAVAAAAMRCTVVVLQLLSARCIVNQRFYLECSITWLAPALTRKHCKVQGRGVAAYVPVSCMCVVYLYAAIMSLQQVSSSQPLAYDNILSCSTLCDLQ